MKYFNDDFLGFFIDLAANNNRDWFTANKKRYEKNVKDPFKVFIQAVIDAVKADDPSYTLDASQAIFRINRDIRFAKDKSPYKLYTSAVIVPAVKKTTEIPGIYLELGPEHFAIYGGAYQMENPQLLALRQAIAREPQTFTQLLQDPTFKNLFGEIRGEQNKRLPAEFAALQAQVPSIANKQFYYMHTLEPETVLQDNLLDIVLEHYAASKNLNQFLAKGMGLI